MKRIGFLTSGGDCQSLNATMRGVAKTLYQADPEVEIYGILEGYKGLIYGNRRKLEPKDFSGILTEGGTIIGTSRQPFKKMGEPDENGLDKVKAMLDNYKKWKLDCLVILGGNGTHKTANLLSDVVTLPKTIDNDIWGTDITFGFQSAVNIATNAIDCIHTTAASHGRVFIVEVMGHKVGWLTLHAGIAGGADIILLPEIPYDIDSVVRALEKRSAQGKRFSILAVAEVRITVPGHMQRGGEPCPYDRVLSTRLGAAAAQLIIKKQYGYMVGIVNGETVPVPLSEVAGKLKMVDPKSSIIQEIKDMGICFGD